MNQYQPLLYITECLTLYIERVTPTLYRYVPKQRSFVNHFAARLEMVQNQLTAHGMIYSLSHKNDNSPPSLNAIA